MRKIGENQHCITVVHKSCIKYIFESLNPEENGFTKESFMFDHTVICVDIGVFRSGWAVYGVVLDMYSNGMYILYFCHSSVT